MKLKVLVGIGVAVVVLIACLWRYNAVQRRSRMLSTRARTAIHAGGHLTRTIAVCLLNSREGGYQLANFVQSALRLATSPLRVTFLCVSDPTATVPLEREIEFNTRDLDFRVDVRSAYAEEAGWFAALSVWTKMLQSTVPSGVLFVNHDQVHVLSGWDEMVVHFLSSAQSGNVYSATSPGTFCILDGHKCGWPLLGTRQYVSGMHNEPVPNIVVDPSMMLMHGTTATNLPPATQARRALRVPKFCGPLLVTDYLLSSGVRPATLPCPFFRPVSASAEHTGDCEALWRSVEKKAGKGEASGAKGAGEGSDDAADRVLEPVTKDWVGILEGLTVSPRAICGLTSSSIDTDLQTREATAKYGSRTQALAAIYEVSSAFKLEGVDGSDTF